jgi:hypothetical protein
MAESLETRQLMSTMNPTANPYGHPTSTVSGTDPQGNQWTLRLYGPGTLNVISTTGVPFNRSDKNTPMLIDTITVAGANTSETRVVGTVYPTGSTGEVYFQNLIVTPSGELGKIDTGQVSNFRTVQNGIAAIDMPDFYMAHTETAAPSQTSLIHASAMSAGEIYIPQGVKTLRFGGVDTDFTPAGATPLNQQSLNAEFQINLGLPLTTGTSVIVNTVNSDAFSSTSSGTTTVYQDYATFLVTGRLNLFQANSITGNTTAGELPTQFVPGTTTVNPGGTYVVSQGGPATGQIGNIRIGGNATNFTAIVTEDAVDTIAAEGQLDAKLSNFYIGGETDNVSVVAPSGARNISFGLGMDNVLINANVISSLRANRDITNSTVTVSRSIGNLIDGGDLTNSQINVGESQSLFSIANTPPSSALETNGTGVFYGSPPPTVVNQTEPNSTTHQLEPFAQNGGTIAARIAGNVTNSVISASVDPNPPGTTSPLFGPDGDSIILPRGVINVKVEGTVNNTSNSLVDNVLAPNHAFFARVVKVKHGPVIPSTVPNNPLPAPTKYYVGQNSLKGLIKIDHYPSIDGRKLTKSKNNVPT